MIMKNIYRFFICLAFCAVISACQDIYKDDFDSLQMDYTSLNVKYEGGKYTFMVYYSGDWTISLDKDVDWVRFDRTSGTGVTMVNVEFDENDALKRSFNMTVSGGDESHVIPVMQASPVSTVVLEFMNKEAIELANNAGLVVAKLKSNLPPSFIEAIVPQTGEPWIQNCVIQNGSGKGEYIYDVAFNVPVNNTGADRNGTITLQFSDSDKEYTAEVKVCQSSQPGELILVESLTCASVASEHFEVVKGGLLNFADFADQIKCSVTGDQFIENVRVDAGMLCFTLPENTTDSSRMAEITLVYGDNLASATIKVVQREAGIKKICEISDLEELLAWNQSADITAGNLIILNGDIDCSGFDASAQWKTNIFSGKFEGNGHTIDNFVIEKAGETAFFARVTESGSVSDLTFGPGCSFTAKTSAASLNNNTYAASLVAFATGNASFKNVVNKGTVKVSSAATGGKGANFIGGICGYFNSKGSFDDCKNYGEIANEAAVTGWTCIGGIVGCVAVSESATVLNRNINTAVVKNAVDLTAALALGGIAGRVNLNTSLAMTECENSGDLANANNATGVYMAGLLGYVDDSKKKLSVDFENCKAAGTLTNNCSVNSSKTALGGFTGFCYTNEITGCSSDMKIINTFNVGTNIYVGGFVGQIEGADPISTVIENCSANVNLASVFTAYSGILIGRLTYTPTATKTVSMANITVSGKYNDVTLDSSNYTKYCYGTAGGNNNYKPVDGVTLK
jgi:hypothetical protein